MSKLWMRGILIRTKTVMRNQCNLCLVKTASLIASDNRILASRALITPDESQNAGIVAGAYWPVMAHRDVMDHRRHVMLGFAARLSGTDRLRSCFWNLTEIFPVRRTWEMQVICQDLSGVGANGRLSRS